MMITNPSDFHNETISFTGQLIKIYYSYIYTYQYMSIFTQMYTYNYIYIHIRDISRIIFVLLLQTYEYRHKGVRSIR